MLRYLMLLSTVFIFYGCAATVKTSVLVPAGEGDVLRYQTVAVFPFGDSDWNDYSTQFESVIASANIDGKKLYTLIDRQQIDKTVKEQNFQMTMADPDSMVTMGKLLGIQAFWVGKSSSEYNEAAYFETRKKCDKEGKNCKEYMVPCVKKVLNFTASPRLISVTTGGVIYSRSLSKMTEGAACIDSGVNVTTSELKAKAMQQVLTDFIKDIAPYRVDVTLEFMSGNKDIADDYSKKLLKDGIAFAKDDRLERACESWQEALDKNPKSVSLNYNIATCFEVKGDYKKAIEILTFTERTMPPGSDGVTVKEALNRNVKNFANATTTQKQIER